LTRGRPQNPFLQPRRAARRLAVAGLEIGDHAPVRVEGMTKTHTTDIEPTVEQIHHLQALGCELVRVAVPTERDARAIASIRSEIDMPLMADIHFSTTLALKAIEAGADSIRLNPGTIRGRKGALDVASAARERGIPIRVGVNSGSMRAEATAREQLPAAMADEALGFCRLLEKGGVSDIIVSVKASDALTTVEAYRVIAARSDYPIHLGVTATGPRLQAVVRSSIGIGTLLAQGIGDTLRVSMTAPPEEEIVVGWLILEALGIRRRGPELISCPTCGRCEIDLPSLVEEVQLGLAGVTEPLKIAVMGCVVNGPGEAAEAQVGVAGGAGFGFIFKNGKKFRKVPEAHLAEELLKEVRAICKMPD